MSGADSPAGIETCHVGFSTPPSISVYVLLPSSEVAAPLGVFPKQASLSASRLAEEQTTVFVLDGWGSTSFGPWRTFPHSRLSLTVGVNVMGGSCPHARAGLLASAVQDGAKGCTP